MKKALSFVLILSIVFPAMATDELYDQISHECEVSHVSMIEELKKVPNYFAGRFSYLFKRAESMANMYPEAAEKAIDTFSSDAFNRDNILLEPTSHVDMLQAYQEAKKNLAPVAASATQIYKNIEENAGPATDALVRGVSRVYSAAEILSSNYPEVTTKVIDTLTSDAFNGDNILLEPTSHVDMVQVYKEAKEHVEPIAHSCIDIVARAYKVAETAANTHPEIIKKVTDAFTSGDFDSDNILSTSTHSVDNVRQVFEKLPTAVNIVVDTTSNTAKESLSTGIFGSFVNKLQTKPALVAGLVVGAYITYRLGKTVYRKFQDKKNS